MSNRRSLAVRLKCWTARHNSVYSNMFNKSRGSCRQLFNVAAALLAHSERQPDKIAFRILDRHADDVDRVTYGELFERACSFAAQMTTASGGRARRSALPPAWIFWSACSVACSRAHCGAVAYRRRHA